MGQPLVSFEFIVFVASVFFLYYCLTRRFQWQFLLVISYVFYALNNRLEYVSILIVVTGINYLSGFLIQNSQRKATKKTILIWSIGFNAFVLLIFKYYHFFRIPFKTQNAGNPSFSGSLIIPLGISYFIFKAISYNTDIYRAKIDHERSLGKFALYISFFPEISAGPIDRAKNLLSQMASYKIFTYDTAVEGSRLMLWGFFKKVVIANNLALYVRLAFGAPREYSGIALLISIYFLAFQLYADFSGYTDIVRGIAKFLGYNIPENFLTPYLSKSISEFWTRWHITLSTWLRDYLFLPLSFFFSKRINSSYVLIFNSNVVIYFFSAIITFFIAGVWHGSALTFILWGLIHGIYLSVSNLTKSFRKKIRKKIFIYRRYPKLVRLFQILLCFHLVAFSWIFFRASTVGDALYIINSSVSSLLSPGANLHNPFELLGLKEGRYSFIISVFSVLFLIVTEIRQKGREVPAFFYSQKAVFRWASYYVLILSIFLFGEFGLREFIYIQF